MAEYNEQDSSAQTWPENSQAPNQQYRFQTPAHVQAAYERAYYEAAGETPPEAHATPDPAAPEQSFTDYVASDAFRQAQYNAQGNPAPQGQPFVGSAYQQPWDTSGKAGGSYSYTYPGYYPQNQQNYYPYTATKDHVAAGLLAIFLGSLGVHKFYLGYNNAGFIMLGVTILGSLFTLGIAAFVMSIIALIEGIIYLTKNQYTFDAEYVYSRKEWF